MNVSDILNKAADLIEPEGAWTQGNYGDQIIEDGRPIGYKCLCVFGAISQCTPSSSDGEVWAMNALADYLGLRATGSVIVWNDDPSRTQAEVVSALRAAAIKAAK